jgi:hypothetical protein
MDAPEFRFLTHWRVYGTVREVADVLGGARELSRWWPSVYLDVEERAPGDENGVGRHLRVRTKGWMPYTLDWEFRVTESRYPFGFSIEATGDLSGTGVWTFEQAGAWTLVTYDWRVRAEKPLLRALSPLFRPMLAANHRWAMSRGEESLGLELARRRAPTPADRARIAPPPSATSSLPVPLILAAVAMGAAVGLALLLSRPKRRRFRR